jgi:RNA polymerase sigma factor
MESLELNNLIKMARDGDTVSREYLIDTNRGFIRRISSYICKRSLDWANDDELSIALIAFNDAIDSFDYEKGLNFMSFSRMLINYRLIDYFSRNVDNAVAMSSIDEEYLAAVENSEAMDKYSIVSSAEEKALEVKMFSRELSIYGLSMADLTQNSPKHRDTRKMLFNTAMLCSRDKHIIHGLKKHKTLPIKEIEIIAKVKRKFLEKWRKYMMALLIIASSDEYIYLKEYIDFDKNEGVV